MTKSDLECIQQPNFESIEHIYTAKYTRLPSVTQIMKPITSAIYKSIPKNIMHQAANRGTEIHKIVEDYDNGIMINESYPLYLRAYKQWCVDTNQKPIANELRVYHKQLMYAGTLDKIAEINGETVLVDLKTTNVLHTNTTAVQTSAYKEALKSWGIEVDKIAVLQLKKDGTYAYVELEDKFDIFLALYKIYGFNMKGKE